MSKNLEQIYESAHKLLVLVALSSNESSDEPAQMCRLARAFAACMQDSDAFRHLKPCWILRYRLLTLKAPITTAADDKFCNIFPNFL